MKETETIVSMDAALSVSDQTRGLDWAHWLLRSVRQRCDGVLLKPGEDKNLMHAQWRTFVRDQFLPSLAPGLMQAWQLVEERNVVGLLQLEQELAASLAKDELERATTAGRVLLKRTRGARYQGALGHYRKAVEEKQVEGNILIVWPAVAHLFQLPPAAMLSEYLRLEWETAVRDLSGIALPFGAGAFTRVVATALQSMQSELRLMGRKEA